jgi:predicted HTH transcriptional regulator
MAFTKLRSVCKQRTHNEFLDTDYESWGIINENGELTNAGALIADESPVRHSRVFCTRWNGLTKAPGLMDAIDDAEFSGSLISLLQEATAFVARNSKKAWKKLPDDRQEMPEYPERAVLESCVNALIHRDYLDYGSEVHIDMFDDRLEIYSPGGMMDGTMVQNLDVLNVPSRRRNPVIADIFNRLRYMDRRGSGFKKIVEDYQMYANVSNGAKPVFKSELSSFFITLPNLQYVVKDVVKEQADILSIMAENPTVTAAELASMLGLTSRHIQRLIKDLVEKEIIRREGGRKLGKWIIL